jgi:hypothetical protein
MMLDIFIEHHFMLLATRVSCYERFSSVYRFKHAVTCRLSTSGGEKSNDVCCCI